MKKKPNRAVTSIRLDAEVSEYLDFLGEKEDRSRNWLINFIVKEHAKKSGYKKAKKTNKRAPRK